MEQSKDGLMRFSEDEFPGVLGSIAKSYGNISAMARQFGVDPSNLHKAIRGTKPPPRRLLTRIGIIPKLTYELLVVETNQK
jgi:hypothetical protein